MVDSAFGCRTFPCKTTSRREPREQNSVRIVTFSRMGQKGYQPEGNVISNATNFRPCLSRLKARLNPPSLHK